MKESFWDVTKVVGPKLVPFFQSVVIFFVLYPTDSPSSLLCLVTKCIPIAFLSLFVIMHGISLSFRHSYSRRILLGLLFSMIGDACLVYKENCFLLGIASFAISHIIYFTAFGIKPLNFRLGFGLLSLTLPVSAIYIPFIDSYVLKVMVPIYMSLILLMLWRAITRLQVLDNNTAWTWPKLCCTLGALFFVISDSILSFDMFVYEVPLSHPLVMVTYYAAQLGIALSTVNSYDCNKTNKEVIQPQDIAKTIRIAHKKIFGVNKMN